MKPTDESARARIESDLGTSFVVEAAAGTGKTTALVRRIVRLLASGHGRITEIAAITFTEHAAGELVLRLRDALERARRDAAASEERERLDLALADFEAAHVGTIHGFCSELLRSHPVDAGVDPAFIVLGDAEQHALLEDVVERFLEGALASPPEGLRRFLRRWRPGGEKSLRATLADSIRALIERRDATTGGRREPFDRDGEVDHLVATLRQLADVDSTGTSLGPLVAHVARWIRDLDAHESVRARDHDGLERALVELPDAKHGGVSFRGRAPAKHTATLVRDRAQEELLRFTQRANADLAFCLGRDLAEAVLQYENSKARLGVLDHVDTLLLARALLVERPRARVSLSRRLRFLFVDEVQDVDPVQKDVILLLASDDPGERDPRKARPRPGALYLVGDPKQAIYGFRRADIRTYLALREQLIAAGAERLELTTSFRPRPAIAALVNRTFAQIFGEGGVHANGGGSETLQAGDVPLVSVRPPLQDFPSVVALPAPRVFGAQRATKGVVEGALPSAVARFIAWLLRDSGLVVEDPELGVSVPLAPRHVAVLFKHLKGNATPYADALSAWHVPHAHVGADAFFERESVIAMSAVLAAIEWPDDELAVYATLKSPFLGITDADLLAYRTTVGPLRPLARHGDVPPELATVALALAWLRELHAGRHVRSVEATLRAFLERTKAEVALALEEDGEGEARALGQLVSLARASDLRAESFRDFTRWLTSHVEDPSLGSIDPTPDPEAVDVVSLLTVHKAKGLEFPVVILASPMTAATFWKGPDRWSDPARGLAVSSIGGFRPIELEENLAAAEAYERAEAARLLYVAATRARDVLVVATGGSDVLPGWTEALQRALRPGTDRDPTRFASFPAFGERSSLDTDEQDPGIRPGHHAAANEGHGVTFWDPRHLEEPPPVAVGRTRTHLIEEAGDDDGSAAEATFVAERERVLGEAALGLGEGIAARRAARSPLGAMVADAEVRLVRLDPPASAVGETTRRRGRRLEAMLEHLFSEPLDGALRPRAVVLGRAVGATAEEVDDAVLAIERLIDDPELGPLLRGATRLAVPYALASDAGPVLHGRVARLIDDGGRLVCLALHAGEPTESSRTELAIAATALARARDRAIEAILAWVP